MILQVVKENSSNIPVGILFSYNDETEVYESMERDDVIADEYTLTKESYYSFSPAFYAFNEEIFNQVKLENNEIKIDIKEEETSQEEPSNDLSCGCEADPNYAIQRAGDLRERIQRQAMEKASQEGESKRSSNNQRGTDKVRESDRKEDERIDRPVTVEDVWATTYIIGKSMLRQMQKEFSVFQQLMREQLRRMEPKNI